MRPARTEQPAKGMCPVCLATVRMRRAVDDQLVIGKHPVNGKKGRSPCAGAWLKPASELPFDPD